MLSVAKIWAVVHTILCLGLNRLIPFVRRSKWGKFLIVIIVINEIRGLWVAYEVVKAGAFAAGF
jgi:hypothetical protein